jgi:hypothetical protein
MSNDRRQEQSELDSHDVDGVSGDIQGVDQSRRKFAKAGLIATPVIMSLTSRPVLGNPCSLSGMLSTTYSGPDSPLPCAGRTPGFWMCHPDLWPQYSTPSGGFVYPGKIVCATPPSVTDANKIKVGWDKASATTLFSDVFGTGLYSGWTMMNLMWAGGKPNSEDQYQLGAHACAAWFNSQRTEFNYGLTAQDVIDRVRNMTNADQLKLEFQTLNERGSIDLGIDYSFLWNQAYWIDQATYDKWLSGQDVECKTGQAFQ